MTEKSKELWGRYIADRSEENRTAIVDFYVSEKLPDKVAGRMANSMPVTALANRDDFRSAAMLGLWKAVKTYDPDKGTKFETYAGRRMLGECRDWIRSVDWITRKGREDQRDGGETPEMCYLESLSGFDTPQSESEMPDVKRLFRYLNNRQRKIIKAIFLESETVETVSHRLGLSVSQVARDRDAALDRLRQLAVPVRNKLREFQQSPA